MFGRVFRWCLEWRDRVLGGSGVGYFVEELVLILSGGNFGTVLFGEEVWLGLLIDLLVDF